MEDPGMIRASEAAADAIIQSACEWLVTLHDEEVTADDRAGFAEWLVESPVHVREYLIAECTWALIGEALKYWEFDLDETLNDDSGKVVPLRPVTSV